MSRFRQPHWLLLSVAAVVGSAGCSGDSSPTGTSGSLQLSLELVSGVAINEVDWAIFGNGMEPMGGTVDTSAPGATASVEVFGLSPGAGYLVQLEAVSEDGEVACRGDATFDVAAGQSTDVMVMLSCKLRERFGGVRINGELNICAELTKVVVSPLRTSVGSDIDLSATAFDPDDDTISYQWFGSGGTIADPNASSTTYTCERTGRRFITVYVSDAPYPCLDTWTVEVNCVQADPVLRMCLPSQQTCSDRPIDPIAACCDQTAPEQQNACAGDESLDNPTSCTPTGDVVAHKLNVLELAPSCNLGYDLDACSGVSCRVGGLAPGEGLDGVDNALTGIGPILAGVGGSLGDLNQALSDSLCGQQSPQCGTPISPTEIELIIDANLEENCANVRVTNGVDTNDVILNLGDPTETGTVCASGTLGTIPLNLLGTPAELDNAVIRMTVSENGFSDGLLGATIDRESAVVLGELILRGLGAVIGQLLDINDDLSGDTDVGCNALSATFVVGGGKGTVGPPGSAAIPYDRTDATGTAPFPDDYWLTVDPSTPTGYRVALVAPPREVDVQVLYLALGAETKILDGFSPTGGIVIPLDTRPDTTSLPLTPQASLDPSASLGLFDLTPGSDTFGQRIPFLLTPVSRRLGGQPINHSLVLYPSIPLAPQGRYAMVVTNDALTNDGRPFEPSPFMSAVLGPPQAGEAPEITKARSLVAEGVLDVLADGSQVSPPIPASDIALAFRISVRSTDDIPRTPLSMKNQILSLPPPSFTITSVEPRFGAVAAVVRGTWEAPNWREEQYFISRDANGDPQVTGTLEVPFVLALPRAAESGPVPVVMFQHGSPGSAEQLVWEADFSLAEAGFAVIGFTDTLNRELGQDGGSQNTVLFETLIREWRFPHFAMQTYGDQMSFLRLIEGLGSLDQVPLPGGDGTPDLDLQAPLTYVGLSMGSVHGSAFLAYAPEIKAAAIAAGAQRQAEQYFNGGTFVDIFPPNLAALLPNATPLDYWVGLSIFQMIFDHQDSHNHATHLYRDRLEVGGTTRKASILLAEGVGDFNVPNSATRSLAWVFGPIPHLEPIWDPSPILEPISGPITANIDAETTAAFYQFVPGGIPDIPHTPSCEFEPNGHFCAQGADEAELQRVLFLRSAIEDPVPTITDPLSVTP